MRVLCISFAAGVFGGSDFYSLGIFDLFGSIDFPGDFVFATGGGIAVRDFRGWVGAVYLSGVVFVFVFLEGVHGAGGDAWVHCDAVHRDAGDGWDSLARKISRFGWDDSAFAGKVSVG